MARTRQKVTEAALRKSPGARKKVSKKLARFVNRDLFEGSLGVGLERTPVFDHLAEKLKEAPEKLPTLAELYRLFDMYNLLHFDGLLPKVKIVYSTRMLAAGSCAPYDNEIRIGVRYHQIFPHELEDTLIHEMIHLIHPGHDSAFKKMARRLGVSVHANSHPELSRPPKYLYQCPGCLREYPRQKRLRLTSCGHCSGDRYDERFKLRLLKSDS